MGQLEQWIGETGAIEYLRSGEELEENQKLFGIVMKGCMYSNRERSVLVDEC